MAWWNELRNWFAGRAEPETTHETPDGAAVLPLTARNATWDDVFHLLGLLEEHKVDYALVGGYALGFNGLVRQTGDVDILVANNLDNNRRSIARVCSP